jgi:hypothetical protein
MENDEEKTEEQKREEEENDPLNNSGRMVLGLDGNLGIGIGSGMSIDLKDGGIEFGGIKL